MTAPPARVERREAHDAVAERGHTTAEQRRRFEAPFALSVGARCAPESKGEQRREESTEGYFFFRRLRSGSERTRCVRGAIPQSRCTTAAAAARPKAPVANAALP